MDWAGGLVHGHVREEMKLGGKTEAADRAADRLS